jgi:hypothetical protein
LYLLTVPHLPEEVLPELRLREDREEVDDGRAPQQHGHGDRDSESIPRSRRNHREPFRLYESEVNMPERR